MNKELEQLEQLEKQIDNTPSSIDVGSMTGDIILAGSQTAIEVVADSSAEVIKDQMLGKNTEKVVGTVGKVAIFLNMAINIYDIAVGKFKWDLVGTLNFVTTTIICLATLGINTVVLGAIMSVLASNPFTVALAVITVIFSYFEIGNQANKIKKQYLACFNSYRRIYKLCNWINTNEIIYESFKKVLNYIELEIKNLRDEFNNLTNQKTLMKRKIFIGAEFNSFVLFTNVITFIQTKQTLSTAKDGTYNEYIDFCSIIDYIDTHEIIKQDKARIEYFILQNDYKGLNDFYIAIDFLNGYFNTYINTEGLTSDTIKDIKFILSCVEELKKATGINSLAQIQKDNYEICNSSDPNRLFNSIYSYLIYSSAMSNSPFNVCNTLLNPEYYSKQSIYSYVSAFSEYPVYLFSNWYFYFGNIMFNSVYIEKYRTQLLQTYQKYKEYCTESFFYDLLEDINNYYNKIIRMLWLYSVKEFLNLLIKDEPYNYYPYYATSFTQSGIDENGKTLFNYYLPENEYEYPNIVELIKSFIDNLSIYGYDSSNKDIFDLLWLNYNYNEGLEIAWLYPNNYFRNSSKIAMVNSPFKNYYFNPSPYTLVSEKTWRDTEYRGSIKKDINFISYVLQVCKNPKDYLIYLLKSDFYIFKSCIDLMFKGTGSGDVNAQKWYYAFEIMRDNTQLVQDFYEGKTINIELTFTQYITTGSNIRKSAKDILSFDIIGFVDWMNNSLDYFKQMYQSLKDAKQLFIDNLRNDIEVLNQQINNVKSSMSDIYNKYPQFDASLSYIYTGKYDVELWNLYKECMGLNYSSFGYINSIEKHLIPVYQLKDGYIKLDTYYPPMFILLFAKEDTDLSQSYYLINKNELETLFSVGNEKFEEKIKEYSDIANTSIQEKVAIVNHQEVIDEIAQNIKLTYELNKDEMLDLLGSQEDEYILIQNLQNQELLKDYVNTQDKKLNDGEVIDVEGVIVANNIISQNSKLANETQEKIENDMLILDKKDILKYTVTGGLLLVLLSMIKKNKN